MRGRAENGRTRVVLVATVLSAAAVVLAVAIAVGLTGGSDDKSEQRDPSVSAQGCLTDDPEGVSGLDRFDELVEARLCVISRDGVTTVELSEEDLDVLRDVTVPDGRDRGKACAPDRIVVDLQGVTADGDSTHVSLVPCIDRTTGCFPSPCPAGGSHWVPDRAAATIVNRALDEAGY